MMSEQSEHKIKQLIDAGQLPEQISATTGLSSNQIIEIRNNHFEYLRQQHRRAITQHSQAAYAMSL
ncbi:hypothetical protein [Amphritea sp. HPY]|uniref:hypothetical protein n=1 Tax=Amphritea sp. HPY TaxID=3421652 RepID=UPI003D7E1B7D